MLTVRTHSIKVPLKVVPSRSDYSENLFDETDVITESGCYSSSIFSNKNQIKYGAKLKRTRFTNGEDIEIAMNVDHVSSWNNILFKVVLKSSYKMVTR